MIRSLADFLPKPLQAFAERFKRGPIDSVETLTGFLKTRSAYVAQTSLYGYLKTRMGTRFRVMFEDDVFAASIRNATVNVFASCLADLTVYAVATANHGATLDPEQTGALARYCYRSALESGLSETSAKATPEKMLKDFDRRISLTNWAKAGQGEYAFSSSCTDLLRHAPVIDEFKELDREIVINSMRFRWRDVREQFKKRIDGEAICTQWHGAGG